MTRIWLINMKKALLKIFLLIFCISIFSQCEIRESSILDSSGESLSEGNSQSELYSASMASGRIPTVVINTADNKPILDKINYIPGRMCITVPSDGPWIGTDTVTLNIRGRGNWTWSEMPKQAYKLKLDKKTSLLGMPKHKHFALISYDTFYPTMWLSPVIGFELGRLIGFPWTPKAEAVEVVLNGEYRGIYVLVESIKTGEDRLNITTQPEMSTDESLLPYGWLVELDNQDDEYQITVPAHNKKGYMRVTHKEPELISDVQRDWLTKEFTYLTQLIEYPEQYPNDKWTNHFDLQSLARYMIVRELLHDVDGYSGSQYFYKDYNSEKWVAGPLWDLELWPENKKAWIFDYSRWSILNWVPFMMKSPELRDVFEKEWNEFYPEKFEKLYDYIDSFLINHQKADFSNCERWPDEGPSLSEKINEAKLRLRNNALWINNHTPWATEALQPELRKE